MSNTVYIIHGCPSNKEKAINPKTRTYDKHWIPWVNKQLSERNIAVEVPLMPKPWYPNHEAFKKEFEKYRSYQTTDVSGSYLASDDSIHILYNSDEDTNPNRPYIDWEEITDQVIDRVLEDVPSPDDDTGAEYQDWCERTDRLIEEELEKLQLMEGRAFHCA